MYEIDKVKARKILIEELHFPPKNADKTLALFPPIREPLDQAVVRWLEDRTVLDIAVEGLTIRQVMNNQGYNFLLAVSNLNKLLDETLPEEERKSLSRVLHIRVEYL